MQVSDIGMTSATVTWNDTAATSYKLFYGVASTDTLYRSPYTLETLPFYTETDITLRAYDARNEVVAAQKITITTLNCGPVENATYRYTEKSGLTLNWNALNERTGITKISISRADSKNGSFTLIAELTDTTLHSYTDTSVKAQEIYYYKIETFDKDGKSWGVVPLTCEAAVTKPKTIEKTDITCTSYIDGVDITWPADSNCQKYIVRFYSSSYTTTPTKEIETEENKLFVPAVPSDNPKTQYFKVFGKNAAGESSAAVTFSSCEPQIVRLDISVEPGKTEATVSLSFGSDKRLSGNTPVVYQVKKTKTAATVLAESEQPVFTLDNLAIDTAYDYAFYAIFTGTIDGETTKKEFSDYQKFTTQSFGAVSGVQVDSVTRSSATVSFTPLTEEQRYGVPESEICYVCYAYAPDSSAPKSVQGTPGSTAPVTVTGLTPDTAYTFKIAARRNGSAQDGDASDAAEGRTGNQLSKPAVPVLSEGTLSAPVSQIVAQITQIPEDAEEDITYGLAYKVLLGSDYTYSPLETAANGDRYITVNAGNTYTVCLYAQTSDSTKSLSDPVTIELQKIPEAAIYGGVYNTTTGKMLDISAPDMWGVAGTGTARSTSTIFNWGILDPTELNIPQSHTVKFSLDTEALGANNVRLFFADKEVLSNINTNRTWAEIGHAHTVKPINDKIEIHEVEKVTKDTATPASANSYTVATDDIFNNAVYIHMKSVITGAFGISYSY